MDHLIQLTEWETGEPLFIDPTKIVLCQWLPAEQYELGDDPIELGGRTKLIVPPEQIVLVREKPAEIQAKLQALKGKPNG